MKMVFLLCLVAHVMSDIYEKASWVIKFEMTWSLDEITWRPKILLS